MNAPPIPSSAASTEDFVPPVQDADKLERVATRALDDRERALERREAAWSASPRPEEAGPEDDAWQAENAAIIEEGISIGRAREDLRGRLAAMRFRFPSPQHFILAVPTSNERDQINSRLISLGLNQVTDQIIRGTMIEELFQQDWAEPGEEIEPGQNETRAEEHANFLDSVWMRQEVHDEGVRQWQAQETERVLDEMNGAPARAPTPLPPKIIGIREQSRMAILIERMMTQSQRLRDLAARRQDFARQNAVLMVRGHLLAVSGFEPAMPIERDPRTRSLSEAAVLAIREQIDEQSWRELVGHIDRMYLVGEDEEKNSASLLERQSPPNGLIEPTGDLASSGGNSTISSIAPAPAAASERTIDRLSVSTSALDPEPASRAASPSLTAVP